MKPSARSARAQIRRAMYAAVQQLAESSIPDILPEELRARLGYPSRREALIHVHFPAPDESLEALNIFRTPAQQRLIFEEFFLYQLSLALDRQTTRKENAIAFRVREEKVREAAQAHPPLQADRRAIQSS